MSIGCVMKCGRIASHRGLCNGCYGKQRARVLAGETTWEKLEAEGHARPPIPKAKQFFRMAINAYWRGHFHQLDARKGV